MSCSFGYTRLKGWGLHKLLEPHLHDVRAWKFDGNVLYTSTKVQSTMTESIHPQTRTVVQISYNLTDTTNLEECTPLLNIIFRTVLSKLKYARLGKNQYSNPDDKKVLEKHKLELWPGYVTSVEKRDGGFMLQTNVSHKMIRTDTAMDRLIELYRQNPSSLKHTANKELIGEYIRL
eukprot:sb/3471931/